MMGFKASTYPAPSPKLRWAAALMGCTVLAGVPGMALAQAAGTPAPAPTPAPAAAPAATPTAAPALPGAAVAAPGAVEEGPVIRSIGVSGAQRLEPSTIVSYIQLRPGQVYTAARADQALVDLA